MPSGGDDLAFALDPALWISDLNLFQDKQGRSIKLDAKQRELLRSPHRRIVVCCHRQWGKSSLASLMVLHRALFYPLSLCLLFSPSLRQSSENFRKILDTLDLHPEIELVEDTRLSMKLANGSRIISLPGSQRTVRNYSAPDLVLIDEAAQAEDALFDAISPMQTRNPGGKIILASTPFGERGFFFKIWTELDGWHKIMVRASDNPDLDPQFLEEEKRAKSSFVYAQEYECQFVDVTGCTLFSHELIESMATDEYEPLFDED